MKSTGIVARILRVLGVALAFLVIVTSIEYMGGHPMGLFAGSRPDGLGFSSGMFKPPSWKPNTVSSTVPTSDPHYIAPITFKGDAHLAWKRVVEVVKAQPRVKLVSERPDYLYAEFKSKGMGFVDDVEFAFDTKANVIHARSGSRLGVRDFGVNRARIEAIRAAFAAK
jgi:uncharacterized protein (DUF1499 family)